MWESLDRLPTYDRLRRTILERGIGSKKERRETDLKDVNITEYFTTQLSNPDVDNEIFLTKLQSRLQKAGVEIPTVEIRYEKVTVRGKVHIGSRALPTLLNTVLNLGESMLMALKIYGTRKEDLTILEGVTGILKPARMTLLLGPPSSGKSTLLLALAGLLDRDLNFQGTITYNGHTLDEFQPKKTAAYISQNDMHMPELTVRETLDFSARYQGVGTRYSLITELLKKEKGQGIEPDPDIDFFMKGSALEDLSHELVTEYTLRIMGLENCADTVVGSQMRQGISGGERKRLTTGEMIVGPTRALFMDEISTGLDSSTTFSVVKRIGQVASITEATVLMALLQPAPETYNLFDDVLLLAGGGEVVYHGPREHVLEFFESCGFKCPPRKSVPDFLQEVISRKDQEQYWAEKSEPYIFVPVKKFSEAFKKFHVGQAMYKELETPYDKTKSHRAALVYDDWLLPQWDLFKITLQKEILLLKRNSFIPIFNLVQMVLMGLICGSTFPWWRMHHRNLADAQMYGSIILFMMNQAIFMGYGELVFCAIRLPLYYKFRDMRFFPGWTWALTMFVLKIPFSVLEAVGPLIGTYYIANLNPAPYNFFRFWVLIALGTHMASGLFRMLAGFCRTTVVASSVGGLGIIVVVTLAGFVLPRNDIKPWWIWGYWATPLSYVQNGLLVVEFLSDRWKKALPNNRHTIGQQYILQLGAFPKAYWYWLACGAMVGFSIFYYLLFAWAITFLPSPSRKRAVVSKELLAELHATRTGETLAISAKATSFPRSISKSLEYGASSRKRISMEMDRNGSARSTLSDGSISSRAHSLGPRRGMILPFQPLAISFSDINYFVDMPAERRRRGDTDDKLQLLRGITGCFRPGILTALVGVTGAGKSTLMDVLAGRKTKGYIEGDIRISGFPKKQETFARIAGYCEQNDIHTPESTVGESIIFSAWLRLPREVDPESKMEFIQEVLDLVELTPLKNALVGVPGQSGLSTEQRKRLTIAVELVSNPSIIFMDEPTSGLDARAATTVMRAVRNTVDTGRTVVCTIHQPSIDIFESFDELLLLKRGGRAVYVGPLGKESRKLIEYFKGIDGVPAIKEGENPAAWMLDVTNPSMEAKLGIDFAEIYKKSEAYERTKALVQDLSVPPPNAEDLSFPTRYPQSKWKQFTCCLWKVHWVYWRSPDYNLMRFGVALFSGLFFGTAYWQLGNKLNTQRKVFSLMGAMLNAQGFYGILTCNAVQPKIEMERTVYYRERSAGMYSPIPYAIAQCLIEVPYTVAGSTLYCLIAFSMMKMDWSDGKFFWYLFFSLFSQLTYVFWGMMMVVLTPHPAIAAICAGWTFNVWGLLNGFFIYYPAIPIWWKWAYWANPITYTLYGTTVSQFGRLSNVYSISQVGVRESVKQLLDDVFGYKYSFLPVITTLTVLLPAASVIIFILGIKYLNYQQR